MPKNSIGCVFVFVLMSKGFQINGFQEEKKQRKKKKKKFICASIKKNKMCFLGVESTYRP